MNKPKTIIGASAQIDFPELEILAVPARIDSGARTSTIWASNIIEKDSVLSFTLFDKNHSHYLGKIHTTKEYSQRPVMSSNGISEDRYVIKLLIRIGGRNIRASFTLANRSTQTYPILVGRNVLRGKFLVDVKHKPASRSENT